jgi:hypothetical protein
MFITEAPPERFDGYNNSADVDIDPTWVDIAIDVERDKTSGFTHSTSSSPAEVTFVKDGNYLVIGKIGVYNSSGTTRSEAEMRFMVDTGSGFAEVAGTNSNSYHRQNTVGRGTMVSVLEMSFSAGDKIKMQAETRVGANLLTLSDSSSLTIIEIKR